MPFLERFIVFYLQTKELKTKVLAPLTDRGHIPSTGTTGGMSLRGDPAQSSVVVRIAGRSCVVQEMFRAQGSVDGLKNKLLLTEVKTVGKVIGVSVSVAE